MIFNVEPGATPRGPKHLNRTVGFSILKDVLLFDIFYLKAPALLETLYIINQTFCLQTKEKLFILYSQKFIFSSQI